MPVIQHKHTNDCPYREEGKYIHYLTISAPDVLWYDVQDVKNYSGNVYGVGKLGGNILIYKNHYGSCSGCETWGEEGEPKNMKEVLEHSYLFDSQIEAIKYIVTMDHCENPDIKRMIKAIKEV